MEGIANFLFEIGMLKKTPRTGYQFLGSGGESVAQHTFRTAVIGYILAREAPHADLRKTLLMCLFHDAHEARTGDHNYVNKQYVQVDAEGAARDLVAGLPFGDDILGLVREFEAGETVEAVLARDADQLDLILELKEQQDLGNRYAREWLAYAVKRLLTPAAQDMARQILDTDWTEWWFKKKTELWVNQPNHGPRDPE